MLQLHTIEPHTLELLHLMMHESAFSGLRLVGGTSLALQYGHRSSVDLDMFGAIQLDSEQLLSVMRTFGKVSILNESPSIHQYLVNDVQVDIVNYAYPWIADCVVESDIRLAAPEDIAALKVNAIEGRGTKKDFIDVFVLLKHFSLRQILDFYSQKYPEHSLFRALLSLSYFDDADSQMMPVMYIPESWDEIKAGIRAAVSAYKA